MTAAAWEHEVFILSGCGTVVGAGGEVALRPGSVVLVPPNEEHHFANGGDQPLTLLCLIPSQEKCRLC